MYSNLQVINNIVEASVSVERVESFLLEKEIDSPLTSLESMNLTNPGVYMQNASFAHEGPLYNSVSPSLRSLSAPSKRNATLLYRCLYNGYKLYLEGFVTSVYNKIYPKKPTTTSAATGRKYLSEEEVELVIKDALLKEAKLTIHSLEQQLHSLNPSLYPTQHPSQLPDPEQQRLITLYNLSLSVPPQAQQGHLLFILGMKLQRCPL